MRHRKARVAAAAKVAAETDAADGPAGVRDRAHAHAHAAGGIVVAAATIAEAAAEAAAIAGAEASTEAGVAGAASRGPGVVLAAGTHARGLCTAGLSVIYFALLVLRQAVWLEVALPCPSPPPQVRVRRHS